MAQGAKPRVVISLPSADDLFTTQEQRDEEQLTKIQEIPLDKIDAFPLHPFKVKDDEDMMNLTISINERGVLTPVTVRKKEDGRYEMLSGHRRKRACEILGKDTIRAEVVEMTKEDATIFMVDSNLQRTKILPSEKAFSYKMKLAAMKKKAGRKTNAKFEPYEGINLTPLVSNFSGLRTNEELGKQVGESREQIRRYIRLTYLIPPMIKLVDEGMMGLRTAVELSYIPSEQQELIFQLINCEQAVPTHAQAIRMRKLSDKNALTEDLMGDIMLEEKPNQKERYILHSDRIKHLFPKDIKDSEREEYIVKALEHYAKVRERKSRDLER